MEPDYLSNFLERLEDYFLLVEQEYVPFAKRNIVFILNPVYDNGMCPVSAMSEVLHYLEEAFPNEVEDLVLLMQPIYEEAANAKEEKESV